MMKHAFQQFLTFLAQAMIRRYKPTIVAITGSVGKTSTKEAIFCVLKDRMRVRMSGGNLNNEFGVPLTILGDWADEYYTRGSSAGFWLKVVLAGVLGLIFPQKYPEVLVLEYGADRPGDIKKLAEAFPPHIAVVTAVGEAPVHVEYYSGPEAVAAEKAHLVRALGVGNHAVLNADDSAVLAMREKTKARVTTFGFSDHADLRAANFEITSAGDVPQGVTFKLHDPGSFVPVKMYGSLGRSQAYAASAAAAVADILGVHLVDVSASLARYVAPKGRLRILPGVKNSVILDDTYNASPAAMHIALEALRDVPGKRKIAVLGDMAELGTYTFEAHRAVGDMAGRIAQVLVCVGEKAKVIADSAANEMPRENVFMFHTSDEAKSKVQELIREGAVVLVKGSQSMRMEKIVEEILADPSRARDLLVRQSEKWRKKI